MESTTMTETMPTASTTRPEPEPPTHEQVPSTSDSELESSSSTHQLQPTPEERARICKEAMRDFKRGGDIIRKTLPLTTLPRWLDPLWVDVDDPTRLPLCWYGVPFIPKLVYAYAEHMRLASYYTQEVDRFMPGDLDQLRTWANMQDWFEKETGVKLELNLVWGEDGVPDHMLTFWSNHEMDNITTKMWDQVCDLLDYMDYEEDDSELMWMLPLPVELVDAIIDIVAELFPEWLLSCALVSREWKPRSMHHLDRIFRAPIITTFDAPQAFMDIVKRHPRLAALATSLEVAPDLASNSAWASYIPFHHLSSRLLPNVRRLVLGKALRWADYPPFYRTVGTGAFLFTGVTTIDLSCHFDSVPDLFRALMILKPILDVCGDAVVNLSVVCPQMSAVSIKISVPVESDDPTNHAGVEKLSRLLLAPLSKPDIRYSFDLIRCPEHNAVGVRVTDTTLSRLQVIIQILAKADPGMTQCQECLKRNSALQGQEDLTKSAPIGAPRPAASSFWQARPQIVIPNVQRSASFSPPPLPSSPPTTPGSSVSSRTDAVSSKRPFTPNDDDEDDDMLERLTHARMELDEPMPKKPRKKRRAARNSWKGWVEGSPPPSEKLINLDSVTVLAERKTRSGRGFDAIGSGRDGWV
ncbi:hypothetical protein GSI_14742 [Ganoderma sinense ZZ0214-1]|uniref:F-box domain-containing protein n=1 Tax=Ganoderma sinense ZZ0214-1 TaxID=1077348 RepID=A0A2G8RPL1_9APHY|nr:hypothetical protein GSI_14742 [Ganoderma sinense ZZ0214-1]